MLKCTVYFEAGISDQEMRQITQAIQLLKGVRFVEEEAGGQHPPYPEPSYQPPPNRPPMENYSQPSPPPQQNFHQPPQGQPRPQQGMSTAETEAIGLNTQRHAINHAIKWAVKKGVISVDELSKMSPEETVKRAMSFIDMMPEEEKKQLGSDLSGYYDNR